MTMREILDALATATQAERAELAELVCTLPVTLSIPVGGNISTNYYGPSILGVASEDSHPAEDVAPDHER